MTLKLLFKFFEFPNSNPETFIAHLKKTGKQKVHTISTEKGKKEKLSDEYIARTPVSRNLKQMKARQRKHR